MSRGIGNPAILAAAKNISPTAQTLLIGGVVGLAVYAIYKVNSGINTVAETLNIKDTKAEKKAKKTIISFKKSNNFKLAFTPDYWIGKMKFLSTISASTALRKAKLIKDSWGSFSSGFDDREETIYGVFRSIASKASMAKLAAAYFVKYKKDLYQDLEARLSPEELLIIIEIVKTKRNFTKKRTKR